MHPSDPPETAVTPASYSDIVIGSVQDPVLYSITGECQEGCSGSLQKHFYTGIATEDASGNPLLQPAVGLFSPDLQSFFAATPPSLKKGAQLLRMSFTLNFINYNATPSQPGTWTGTISTVGVISGPVTFEGDPGHSGVQTATPE